ncbi:MAG: serine/threonine protein kinase [Moraxellaceae bacterium]|jgi:serine/threonine protein kinase|nr:serine/threonine protein kinase [Moraxellaceae bacterium]
MKLADISRLLISHLERNVLDGRYANLEIKNVDLTSGIKRGCFSLVFKAFDAIDQISVAIKIFDIDPSLSVHSYRFDAFRREHEILQALVGKDRCLQLASTLKSFDFSVPLPGTGSAKFPVFYFVVEWIDDDIDEYFLSGSPIDAVKKLRLFNDIVLAVEALHRNSVFHRDIKPDNLRSLQVAIQKIVAIDMGTAARYSSAPILPAYGGQAGHIAYSAPEALCGLAGNRKIAPMTDVYALGCLLFELFNADMFAVVRESSGGWTTVISAMRMHLSMARSEQEMVDIWRKHAFTLSRGLPEVRVDGYGSGVPAGVGSIIRRLVIEMTEFDFERRTKSLESIRQRIWGAIKLLENQRAYSLKLARIKAIRQRRNEANAVKDGIHVAISSSGVGS